MSVAAHLPHRKAVSNLFDPDSSDIHVDIQNIFHPRQLYFHDKNISSFADLENFIKAIVYLRVDYCNALFTT